MRHEAPRPPAVVSHVYCPSPRPPTTSQQTARVNVDDARWQAFRIRAIQTGRSVADELGRLVRNDLRHSLPPEPSKPSTGVPSGTGAREPLDAEPSRRPTPTVRRGRTKQRLSDLDLLTELPYRDQPRPGGSRSA